MVDIHQELEALPQQSQVFDIRITITLVHLFVDFEHDTAFSGCQCSLHALVGVGKFEELLSSIWFMKWAVCSDTFWKLICSFRGHSSSIISVFFQIFGTFDICGSYSVYFNSASFAGPISEVILRSNLFS